MPTPESALVREVLDEYGTVVRARLGEYLRTGEPRRHLYDLMADYPSRGGRSLRASLCIAAARAFGAPLPSAVDSAVALELLHNAFLVHDDVEDESEQRRGQPALHEIHGVPLAINAGDALIVLSLRPLIENRATLGVRKSLEILSETERMARESVEGQALELGWRRDNAVDLRDADYFKMILKKTCWYTTIYPCRVGAIIGARGRVDSSHCVRFGFLLGSAFQIVDDVLNLTGDPDRYGKELDGDIWEGKRTLMIIRLLQRATRPELTRVRRLLGRSRRQRSAADVTWVRARMKAYGCIEHARQVAHGLAGAAQHEFSTAFAGVAESRDKAFIRALTRWVIERL